MTGPVAPPPRYRRDETEAHQLDRNWAELVQELRVIGTGVQVLFAFLLGIAFQTRFAQTTSFERAIYLTTLLLSALSAALMIAPVAFHRLVFRTRFKDELVTVTNGFAITGLIVLSLAMSGAVLLVADWVEGTATGVVCGAATFTVLLVAWFAVPLRLRRLETEGEYPARVEPVPPEYRA